MVIFLQFLIFDESTSSLDSHSENEILKTIRILSGSKTIITIAHRLSTVLISDRVALMEDGKIVAIERPSNMFTANGKFNALFEHQLNNVCNMDRIINQNTKRLAMVGLNL